MSIESTNKNLNKYDYNHDGAINHDDVEAFILDLGQGKSGNIRALLRFQKAGGELNIEDIKELVGKCKVDGAEILRFVEQGGKMTKEDADALIKAGVEFTPKEMEDMAGILGLKNLSVFPSGTKPSDLISMAGSGTKKVTAEDMLSLKGPDGKPLATVNDFLKLREAHVKIPASVLLGFQQEGGTITGADLVKFADAGVKFTSTDLVGFAKEGMAIKDKELTYIIDKAKITLTQEDFTAINPISTSTGKPILSPDSPLTPEKMVEMSKFGIKFTGAEMVALKGPDGKPLATTADLIKLAQAGNVVTPTDVIALQKAGVSVTGNEVATLVTHGAKFTGADLVTLTKGGTQFAEDQLRHICNNSGIGLTKQEFIDINPICLRTGQPYVEKVTGPVTIDPILTPEALAAASSLGVPVSVSEAAASMGGTLHIEDIIKFAKEGGKVTVQELVDLMKSGTKVTSRELDTLHQAGMAFNTQDLITLSNAGCTVFDKDIAKFIKEGLKVTFEDFVAINPTTDSGSKPDLGSGPYDFGPYRRAMDLGIPVSSEEFMAAFRVQPSKNAMHDYLDMGGTLTAENLREINKAVPFESQDLIYLVQKGTPINIVDILEFTKNGINIDGDQLVKMVDGGLKLTAADIVDLKNSGMDIWHDDLDYICKKLDIALTDKQLNEINPIDDNGNRLLDNRDYL